MEYSAFLKQKQKKFMPTGIQVDDSELNSNLFPFQRFVVKTALNHGRFAIFADCGLGKTLMQLSWADIVGKNMMCPVLILAPLAVTQQTIDEGKKFGIDIDVVTIDPEYTEITNYEQLSKIDPSKYSGVVMDESSILKNKDGNDEKHICPLQLDTIERILHLYSNEGETVFSPFGGIGSEGFAAIKMSRKSISIELKESYFKLNERNHRDAVEEERSVLTLFEGCESEEHY